MNSIFNFLGMMGLGAGCGAAMGLCAYLIGGSTWVSWAIGIFSGVYTGFSLWLTSVDRS